MTICTKTPHLHKRLPPLSINGNNLNKLPYKRVILWLYVENYAHISLLKETPDPD